MERAAIDTSVVSAYYNVAHVKRQLITRHWWKRMLPQFTPLLAEVTLRELQETRDAHLRSRLLKLVATFEIISENENSEVLALEYVRRRVIPLDYANDARQIAVASVAGAEYLVSWNFTHMVNEDTRRGVAKINHENGHPNIRIVSPLEFGGEYNTI